MATFRNGLLATATLLVGVLLPIAASAQLEATAGRAETDNHLSKEYSVCIDKAVEGAWADMFACNGEELDRQDARLNNAYKKLMSKLSRDRKKALLKAQRTWIKFREANCDYYFDPYGGTAARLNASGCLLTTTAARTKELEGMLEGLD
jgi:uncharacterized protein YecT (DUF1311 family)